MPKNNETMTLADAYELSRAFRDSGWEQGEIQALMGGGVLQNVRLLLNSSNHSESPQTILREIGDKPLSEIFTASLTERLGHSVNMLTRVLNIFEEMNDDGKMASLQHLVSLQHNPYGRALEGFFRKKHNRFGLGPECQQLVVDVLYYYGLYFHPGYDTLEDDIE